MMAVCEDDPRGTRDRALIAVGFESGGRRRSELAAMTLEALERHCDDSYTYMLGRSTTNPLARPRPKDRKPIQGAAADDLTRWLELLAAAGIDSGPIWRRIEGPRLTTPLSETAIYDVIVKRAREAGIPGAVMAHSIRARFVTEELSRNFPIMEIMDKTGHETLQSIRDYDRPEGRSEDDPTA
jgi:site-specific recombinase XerC